MKRFALIVVVLVLAGCASPAADYVLAEQAAWVPFDKDGWLDRKIDEEPSWSPEKKDALHELNVGRRARVRHGVASVSSANK